MRAAEFLGGRPDEEGSWRFELGRELHGAFGGAFGGVVAAATLIAARPLAEGREPAALDIRFLRSLPAGTARARSTLLHAGRSLSCVSVDVHQDDARLVARATISFVAPGALSPLSQEAAGPPLPSYDEGRSWPPIGAPIIETLAPRTVPWPEPGVALAMRIPWDDPGASAEAACLPADMCVGPPVALSMAGEGVAHPNPDLSLRFAAPVVGDEVVGAGRLERVHSGLATVGIEVWSGSGLVAVGVSTSMLLAGQ